MTILNGTDGDDVLEGSAVADLIRGLGGNDTLFGYAGDDSLRGGSGNDFLEGMAGRDVFDGGGGNDVMYVNVEGGDLAAGEETYIGGVGYDSISFAVGNPVSVYGYHDLSTAVFDGVEKILIIGGAILTSEQVGAFDNIEAAALKIGTTGRTDFAGKTVAFGELAMAGGWLSLAGHTEMPGWLVTGSNVADTLIGGDTANRLFGLRGDDVLRGGVANDELDGGNQNDTLIGNAGNDVLRGGNGLDRLTGGAGSDRFDFNNALESRKGATRDIIRDFTQGSDHIDLDGVGNAAGVQLFLQSAPGAAFSGQAGELRVSSLGALTLLAGDLDGDRIADFEIGLVGAFSLHDSDFLL